MADKAKKISELTAATSVAANDLFVIVGNTSGTSTTKKITVANLFANVDSNTTFKQVVNVGANVSLNTTAIKIGNSTVNVSINSSIISVGSDLSVNATTLIIGSTLTVNATSIKLGNSTINTVVNSSAIVVSGDDALIKAGVYEWLFDYTDGLLYVPNGFGNTSGIAFPNDAGGGSGDFSYIHYYPYAGAEDMVLELRVRNNGDDKIRLDTSGRVEIITSGHTAPNTWIFHANGSLQFPGNTHQTTAWAGIPGPYADDTAAATAGVAVGYPYHKTGTGGQVFVRLT